MNLAIDTDALIKLTKSSSKAAVGKAFTVLVPPEVERECVEQGKAGGFPDALRVEENVEKGALTGRKPKRSARTEAMVGDLRLSGGEADRPARDPPGGGDQIASDDPRALHNRRGLGTRMTGAAP